MKFLVIFFVLISVLVSAAGPSSVQTDQNNGYALLSTYTWEIAADEVLDLNDVLGSDNAESYKQIKGFKFRVYGGDAMLIPEETLDATGTYKIGEYVASGTAFPGWTGLRIPRGDDFNLFVAPLGSALTVTFWAW